MASGEEELEFLLRSDNRTDLLVALDEGGPLDRYDLERRVDTSRRTVTRVVEALGDRGYIREAEGGYDVTAFGATLADVYRDCVAETSLAEQYRPFLRHVDSEEFDVDLGCLDGADLLVASDNSPFRLLNRILELRAEATQIRELAPAIERRSVEQLARRLENGEDFGVEVILPPDVIESAGANEEFAVDHQAARDSDAVDFYVYPDQFTMSISVMDETVALVAGAGGQPHAMIESDNPELRAWAENRLDEYRQASEPLAAEG